MFNIDITKALHPKTFGAFAPLMPGLFFEISVLLSGRYSVRDLFGRAQLGYVTTLGVALIMAYVIGNASLLWVRLVQIAMTKMYGFASSKKAKVPPTPNAMRFEDAVDRVWCQATVQLLKQGYGIDFKDKEAPEYSQVWYGILGNKPDDEWIRGRPSVMHRRPPGGLASWQR